MRGCVGLGEDAPRSVPFSADDELCSEPVVIEDDAAGQAALIALAGSAVARSGVTVPILGPGRAFGVLCLQSERPRRYTCEEIDFAQASANILADAIERRRAEEQIRQRALHDALTGLPNRTLFVDRLSLALAHSARRGGAVAALFIDLDRFKLVNDSLGHAQGDELLRALATRLSEQVRVGDTLARFGGDEFVILCDDLADAGEATTIAERVETSLERPFVLDEVEHFVRASIGIAASTGFDRSAEDLIREADAAMYRAKEMGRGRHEMYDEAMRGRATERLRLENQLSRALDLDELQVHYQPVVALETGQPIGVEALLRWDHPERGLVSPAQFIPVAEDTGMIVPIGEWVLREACRQAVTWRRERPDVPLTMSVNLSLRQVAQPTLPDVVRDILEQTGLDPSSLHLEITESVLMEATELAVERLARLKALGVTLVLDDFGTGYSSLAHVKRFPIDVLKIDRSFVADLDNTAEDVTIVEAVINMARGLRVEVIAEGVETPAHVDALTVLGCGQAQGFYYSRPLPADEVARLLVRPLPAPAARAA